ncbi:hypothetical protein Poli38472_007103 [Pythium oligandrum]|uniref:Uncharacterized protein n=1 Tax=Pythium oligandrum TaxID=41045 RepID=A0A8K1CA52_PYTOL|nr:hypothetical protein Poli38472_007103 [Pythium oligandrum]|eukprot:TMW58958.1 hypothetical protein Poli38472_007103 [Pythium oligandrum]
MCGACYDKYYRRIETMLLGDNKGAVSVGGDRHRIPRHRHAAKNAIEASVIEAFEKGKKVHCLRDGPPTHWTMGCPTVVFTSPDVEWLQLSRNDACDVYMPLWTLDELRDAVQVLDLPIADHELDDRFDRCGGIPRPCLAQENEVVDRAMADCERAIASVTGPNQLVQVLCEAEEDDDRDACRYLLVHDEPSDDDPSWSVRRLASAYVSRRLLVKMAHSTDEQRGVLRGLVDQNTRLEWFRGWLTELEQRAMMRVQYLHEHVLASQ